MHLVRRLQVRITPPDRTINHFHKQEAVVASCLSCLEGVYFLLYEIFTKPKVNNLL